MKKFNAAVIAAGLLCLPPGAACADDFTRALIPPAGKTLLFVGQDRDTIARYVEGTGHDPAGVMLYTAIQDLNGLEKPKSHGGGFQDGNALLRTYPQAALQIGLYMVGALEDVAAGTYDGNIKSLARWIKKADRPVYLRIGYEFDSPENKYDPELYRKAFRRVVDFMRKEDVRNTAYVWHSYGVARPDHPWMDWYPGDEYVDWFGASAFNTGLLWAVQDFLTLARARQKPFMLAESAPAGSYSQKGKLAWFTSIFTLIKEKNIEAFSYINSNWDEMPMFQYLKWGDSRVEADDAIRALWMEQVNQERYHR